MVDGAVEVVGGLVAFELTVAGGLLCLGKKSGALGGGEQFEGASYVESLLDVGERFAAGDDDTRGQIHGVVEALDGGKRIAAEEETGAHGFHAEDANFIFYQDRKDVLPEALVMSVHGVEGHLDGVEMKFV